MLDMLIFAYVNFLLYLCSVFQMSKLFLHSGQPFQVSSQKFTIFKIPTQFSSQPFSGLVSGLSTLLSRVIVGPMSMHCRSIVGPFPIHEHFFCPLNSVALNLLHSVAFNEKTSSSAFFLAYFKKKQYLCAVNGFWSLR